MFHPEDDERLRKMLGLTGEYPVGFEDEYNIRLRLHHAAGQSGAIGPTGLVDLVRACNLEPPKQEQPKRIDFRQLPRDTTRVRTKRNGDWQGGVFLGLGDNGKIYVRLDGDNEVREVANRPDVLRLEHVDYVSVSAEDAQVIASAPDGQMVAVATLDPIPVRPPEPAHAAVDAPDDGPADGLPLISWGEQAPGIPVWCQNEDGDVSEGKLSHTDEAGQVFVLVDGNEQASGPFDPEDVFLAS